jgi:hypothetical protein
MCLSGLNTSGDRWSSPWGLHVPSGRREERLDEERWSAADIALSCTSRAVDILQKWLFTFVRMTSMRMTAVSTRVVANVISVPVALNKGFFFFYRVLPRTIGVRGPCRGFYRARSFTVFSERRNALVYVYIA